MKLFCFLVLAAMAFPPQNLLAQGQLLACNGADSPHFLAPPKVEIQEYYEQLIAQYGSNDRYRACELALERYGCKNEEYSAKLYNTLAEEALLMRNYEQAKWHYDKVLKTDFEPGYYTEGLVAERAKLTALAGLRTIGMEEKDFETALYFHKRYVGILEADWPEIAQRNKLANDKIYATCYQFIGASEKAIAYLMPYAFGAVAGTYGEIDKQAVDYLTELLRTKYPKKVYKRFLNNVANELYTEVKDGQVLFYLQVLENRIYFQNDSANFCYRAAADEQLIGEGVAHYQRKLLHSYFYQSLLGNK